MKGQREEIGDPTARTDYDSQTVMMTAERHDNIVVKQLVKEYKRDSSIPNKLKVIKKIDRFHGPEILTHARGGGSEYNYLLTAPGPKMQLFLWVGVGPVEGIRRDWALLAEIKATLAAEQPPYQECQLCGELIRTIEHERKSVMGNCNRGNNWVGA